jgi:hypothetical protein
MEDAVNPLAERRTTLDRLRVAVGRTLSDGLTSVGIPAAAPPQVPARPETSLPPSPPPPVPLVPPVPSVPQLPQSEPQQSAREAALQRELLRLRAESSANARAATRSERMLEALRAEVARVPTPPAASLPEPLAVPPALVAVRSADIGRIESLETRLLDAQGRLAHAKDSVARRDKDHAALERVCMRLRRRLAAADEHAARAAQLDHAILAREKAEAALAGVKDELEHLRAELVIARETGLRTEAAGSETVGLRARVEALEKELRSRDQLLHQAEESRLQLCKCLARCEKELRTRDVNGVDRSSVRPPPRARGDESQSLSAGLSKQSNDVQDESISCSQQTSRQTEDDETSGSGSDERISCGTQKDVSDESAARDESDTERVGGNARLKHDHGTFRPDRNCPACIRCVKDSPLL